MTRRRPLRLLVLPLLLLPLSAIRAGEDGAGKIDILKVTPEEILGRDTRPLLAEAQKAYREKRYEDAARTFIEVLRRAPGDANSVYNLACCYGLLGAEGQAARFLLAAYRIGFRDLEHVRRDPDFDRVRRSEDFRKAMEVMARSEAERKRRAGTALLVTAPVLADVRVVEPAEMEPGKRYPLVIGLHGYGDHGENFAGLFTRRGLVQDFLFCVPQAPYAFSSGPRFGYSWTRGVPERRGSGTLSLRLSEKYVLAALRAVKREYPVDERRVFLLGFSQGAGMAFSIGMRHPDLFRGVIPVGGWLDPGEFSRATVGRAAKEGLFLVCHSPEDRVVPVKAAEKAVEFLAEGHIPFRFLRYEGGHSLPVELLNRILVWMKSPAPD